MKGKLRTLIALLAVPLPWLLKRQVLRLAFGYDLHPTARIGLSLVLCDRVSLGEKARIGHLTFIGKIAELKLQAGSKIGNMNWIAGIAANSSKHFQEETDRLPALHLGEHASMTARHFIDCCNLVSIGKFTTIAGARSQILTHAIDISTNRQRSAPVHIGDYCFVGTGCILLKGCRLPDKSVLAAGTTLTRYYTETLQIYAGSPAQPVKALPADSAYFNRTTGFVP